MIKKILQYFKILSYYHTYDRGPLKNIIINVILDYIEFIMFVFKVDIIKLIPQ